VAKAPKLDYEALEKEWLRAQDEGDVPVLAQMYDDDFVGTTFTGKLLTRGDILPEDQGPIEPKTRSLLEDVQGRTYGDTAVTLGQVNSGGMHYRFTKVYVFKDGVWKLVTAHLSRVAE
jgi:ketosteroid isomerase-like protein